VRGIISVDISEWSEPGLNGKAAKDCSPEEIKVEVWEQLKRSLNYGDVVILKDEQVHSWSLDPDIRRRDDGTTANEEPLLVNLINTWELRPEAVTKIPHLFLASDYVRTNTDLATMEAANEAARRAVNGILDAARSTERQCDLWKLHEPEIFVPWRELDLIRYQRGLPWDDTLVRLGMSFIDLADKAILALESGSEEHQALFSLANLQAQGGTAGTVADLRRDATDVVERIVRALALRLVEAQGVYGGVSPATAYARPGRVEIIPR
jgi:hypothetical protein